MNTSLQPAPEPLAPAKLSCTARWALWVGAILIGGVMLYALSFGPAVMLAQRRAVRTETVEKLYSPLETLAFIIPGGDGLLKRYVSLWAADEPPR